MRSNPVAWLLVLVLVGACDGDTGVARHPPRAEAGPADALPVAHATEDRADLGFRVSGRVHPAGRPATWYVEYGPTIDYGSRTDARSLPGRLSAHFVEDWSSGLAGWAGGMSGAGLVHHQDGGEAFVRFTDRGADDDDVNHIDGIGTIHLPMYGYFGNVLSGVLEQPSLVLGGGHPDLRGARMSMRVRGVDWSAKGTTLATWLQMDLDPTMADQVPMRRANWANTGATFGDRLASGAWEIVDWTLDNRLDAWTYAGQYGARNAYLYKDLDASLADVNVNVFPAQMLHIDRYDQPGGAIDFDDLTLTFRNHSVLVPSNGGRIVAAPDGDDDPAALVDGWRFGVGREWTVPAPAGTPPTVRWAFDRPITLVSVLVHQSVAHPSTLVDVRVSSDGGATFVSLGARELPTHSELGPNFLFHHQITLDPETTRAVPLHPDAITHLEVLLLEGPADAERWGLGEVEAFGTGAVEATEDAWYDVNRDVLVPPGAYHHRLVVTTDAGTAYGADVEVVVPALPAPTVAYAYPATVPAEGGVYVAIHGTHLARQVRLTIGGVPIAPYAVARDLTDVMPPPGRGTCDITITTESGTATLVGGLAYEGDDGLPDPGPCALVGP